ncbi:MAG: hypothetical protein ACREKS_03125 [Candidatus Rokuibacteriota bacterium]
MDDDLLAQFLGAHEGAAFCCRCLAEMLAIPESDVISAARRLQAAGRIALAAAPCANCSQGDAVIRCLGPEPRAAEDDE